VGERGAHRFGDGDGTADETLADRGEFHHGQCADPFVPGGVAIGGVANQRCSVLHDCLKRSDPLSEVWLADLMHSTNCSSEVGEDLKGSIGE
jgi:hypothetical protein